MECSHYPHLIYLLRQLSWYKWFSYNNNLSTVYIETDITNIIRMSDITKQLSITEKVDEKIWNNDNLTTNDVNNLKTLPYLIDTKIGSNNNLLVEWWCSHAGNEWMKCLDLSQRSQFTSPYINK